VEGRLLCILGWMGRRIYGDVISKTKIKLKKKNYLILVTFLLMREMNCFHIVVIINHQIQIIVRDIIIIRIIYHIII